jgi:fructose-1,6-bisphosphatase/inositol monophosphatase family enzyme
MDGFWEGDLKAWDIAAARYSCRGRRPGDRDGGQPFDSREGHVLATNGLIHPTMVDVIRDFTNRRQA